MVGLLLNRFPDRNSAEAQCQRQQKSRKKSAKPKQSCGEIPPLVLDMEWVLVGESFWIVQDRPYVSGGK